MSWRDGTNRRTAKSIAQCTISDTFVGDKSTKIPSFMLSMTDDTPMVNKEKQGKKRGRKPRSDISSDSENPPKKRRLRAPSPPKMNLPSRSTRRTNTSADTDYFIRK